MKIPLEYIDKGRIIANVTLFIRGTHTGFFTVQFVIDTGSPETFISEGDALKTNLPLNKFSLEKHTNMGGSKYELNILKKSTDFYFKDEENKSIKIILPSIKLSKCTKTNLKEKQTALGFPSIIGTDFLEQNNLILYCDLKNNNCYLELKD